MIKPNLARLTIVLLALSSLSACKDDAPTAEAKPALPATGCGALSVPISDIQGDDAQSPLLGKSVSIQAVVTYAAVDTLGGIFVQEEREDRDGEPDTSEALFLLADGRQSAQLGEVVRATGMVAEIGEANNTMTALSALSEFRVCGEAKLPSETSIEQAPLVVQDWERFEAMRVHMDTPLTVLDNVGLRRFGELLVSLNGRQMTATELVSPGEEARKHTADNQRHRLLLDDASLALYPQKVSYLITPLSNEAPYRVGTRLGEVRGILDQRSVRVEGYRVAEAGVGYRLHVLSQAVAEQAVRPRMPPDIKGNLRIMSFNMLNWFNGDGKGKGFENSRGAKDTLQAADQRSKLIAAFAAAKPDIAGLMEVENDGEEKLNALSEFVQALNRQTGLGYQIVNSPQAKLGGDQIKVAIIYRPKAVQLFGAAASIETPPFDDFNRPPLAQSFQQGKNGPVFTVVVNHFKSKGCGDPARLDEANRDKGDGQACFNAKRVEAAKALLAWLANDPTQSHDSDFLLLGDFNAYSQEEPIRVLQDGGFMRLGKSKDPHYSYVYNGESGSLDHGFASDSLRKQVSDSKVWHINADEYEGFDYLADAIFNPDGSELSKEQIQSNRLTKQRLFRRTAFRSSDHDPLLIGLKLEANEVKADAPKSGDAKAN